MSLEHTWNVNDRAKPKYWKNLSHCSFIRNRNYTAWPGIEAPTLSKEEVLQQCACVFLPLNDIKIRQTKGNLSERIFFPSQIPHEVSGYRKRPYELKEEQHTSWQCNTTIVQIKKQKNVADCTWLLPLLDSCKGMTR
jgi:hypothetical protein